MHLSVKKEDFLKVLQDVRGAVQPRSTIPILSHVKIDSADKDGGSIRLTATDMGLSASETATIDSSTAAKVVKGGSLTAPASQLANIVQRLPEKAEVDILKEAEDFVLVKSGRSEFKLRSLPVGDFPNIEDPKNPTTFKIKASELAGLFSQTAFSMSRDEIRYYLNGVYLHVAESEGKKVLRAVATDGHRMAISQIPAPKGSEGMAAGIVPSKAVREFEHLFGSRKGDAEVAISKNSVGFFADEVRLITRLVEGSFPEYVKVVPPKEGKAELVVDARELSQMVQRVTAVSDEPIKALGVNIAGNHMELTVSAPDNASSSDSTSVKHKGEMKIGFNAQYLLDILRQIEKGSVQMSLNGDSKPSRINAEGRENPLYVLMPMRI